MKQSRRGLGGRLPLLAPTNLGPEQRRLYDSAMAVEYPWSVNNGFQLTTEDGRFIGPYNAFLRRPEVAEKFREFADAASRTSSLSPQLREVVILAVGSVWDSEYEIYAHRIIARNVGIPDGDADALSTGRSPELSGPDAELVFALVRELTAEHCVEEVRYEQALTNFGEQALFDIVALAGQYMVVCSFLNFFEVPAPEENG